MRFIANIFSIFLIIICTSQTSCRKFVWDNPNDGINQDKEPASLKDGLVAYYPFNGNANDESVNSNDGLTSSVVFSIDRKNSANSAISISEGGNGFIKTNGVIENAVNTFTISLWVKPDKDDQIKSQTISSAAGSASQAVIHPTHGQSWGPDSQHTGIGVNIGKNQIQLVEHTGAYVGSPLVFNTNLNGWHHILIQYENKTPSLFIDGEFKKRGLTSIYPNVHPSNGFCSHYSLSGFGRSFAPQGNIGQFIGSFDDIRIYNRALTQSEITYLATH
ncbi:MAG: LamG domain-containing protein [Chitinophagaceae bacterium]|jgi:hypothetical protein